MKNGRATTANVLEQSRDVLIIPESSNIMDLAAARYEDVTWLVSPQDAAASKQQAKAWGGARFHGAAPVEETVEPQLKLADEVILTGPYALEKAQIRALSLTGSGYMAFVLPHSSGSPADSQVMSWALAAARHSGGLVMYADGGVARPNPEELVALRLFSADPQPVDVVADALRPVLPRVQSYVREDGEQALFAALEYDGTITVSRERAGRDLPPVLATVNWRDYGPHVYEVSWIPPGDVAADLDDPSSLAVIARRRAVPLIARAIMVLQQRFEGTVVDTEGFLVRPEGLDRRARGR